MMYDEALAYIHNTLKFGTKPGLRRIREMLARLDNPHKKVKFVHVAGTNGKGSTTAMVTNILRSAGYKVGMFISPFVEDFRERIQVDGRYITEDELCFHLERLLPVIEKVKEIGFTHPLEFEIVTTLAFDFFAEQKCDYVVLEVGLGGKYDCTNVIDAPLAAVIASISLDHTKVLGNTVSQIAREKSGIIKSGTSVVCYAKQPDDAFKAISDRCSDVGAELNVPDLTKLSVLSKSLSGTDILYDDLNIHIPFVGDYQIYNTLSVVETARILQRRGVAISNDDIVRGIANTRFPGRMEIVWESPVCIIDGGHNPDGVRAMCESIDSLRDGKRLICVMAMFEDKEYSKCVEQVAKRADAFIATQINYHRALDACKLADIAKNHCEQVLACDDIKTAVIKAMDFATIDDIILVCGSLYSVSPARDAICDALCDI